MNKEYFNNLVKFKSNVVLWCYKSKTGELIKHKNVDIYKDPFYTYLYFAMTKEGFYHLVSKKANIPRYFDSIKEYKIWSTTEKDEIRIKYIISSDIRKNINNDISKYLDKINDDLDVLLHCKESLIEMKYTKFHINEKMRIVRNKYQECV